MNPILPPEGSFLNALKARDVDGYLGSLDKEMLVETLKFYFGPAQWGNAVVKDVMNESALDKLNDDLRKQGGRYEILEGQTGLDQNYFGKEHPPTDQVKLYAATETGESYFLYEASKNLTFYVGPPDPPRAESDVKVINTLVLDDQHRPRLSHTLDFGFMGSEKHDPSPKLDGPSLAELQPEHIDGQLILPEKEMLLAALRFYFGPAQQVRAPVVQDKIGDFDKLTLELRERYQILEQQTGLPAGYFGQDHAPAGQVKLYVAATRDTDTRLPCYHLYETSKNLTFYVGPDIEHKRPTVTVINTIKLNDQHLPLSSHTLDFGFVP